VDEQIHGIEFDGLVDFPEDELVLLQIVGLLVVWLLQVQLQKLSKHAMFYYNPMHPAWAGINNINQSISSDLLLSFHNRPLLAYKLTSSSLI
jgi:hypothetical protein